MTGKTAQSYYVLTTATFQAYRRLTVKCVRSINVPINSKCSCVHAHAYYKRTYVRIPPYIYIYIHTASLNIEHPREWLASLADNLHNREKKYIKTEFIAINSTNTLLYIILHFKIN